ncbi:hypothetical protein MOPEL_091_00190 [Mobilicoccus pelagius NBRC 104925]|uniref:Uncharacterized protein n=1 Tax=Mobilicoccus pelagius NBRC 104925 TaxID=1089455 RepID=H5UTB6_9MICO|nr:hypothetical protein MOPEL_091_00190 [Mobilicoccus pelagius NBRC 104925]
MSGQRSGGAARLSGGLPPTPARDDMGEGTGPDVRTARPSGNGLAVSAAARGKLARITDQGVSVSCMGGV